MSDDVVLTSLEDDAPAPPPAEPAPVAAAQEPTAPPAEPDPEPVEAVEVAGQRVVPVAALIAERKARQEAERQAARVPELEAWHQQAAPYVEFLRANPDFLKPKAPEPMPAHQEAPKADPALQTLAQTLDLYDAQGQPDTKRASVIKGLIDQTVQQQTQAAMQPFQQQTAEQQSQANFARVLQIKDADGRTPSPQMLAAVWRTMPLQDTADPKIATVLAATSLGLERMQGKTPPAAPAAALLSEPSGGHPQTRPTLSRLEEKVAAERGRTPTQWQDTVKGFQSGRQVVLED